MEDENLEYETGIEVGKEEALAELQTQLVDDGYDPDDVQELLYDPAPKKRKKGTRKKTNQRTYRPIGGTKKRKTTAKKPKKGLAKLRQYAMPGAAGLTFYGAYVKRADELFKAGKITKDSVYEAIKYDAKNFDSKDAMQRLKDNAGEIVTPFLGAKLVQELKPVGKYSGLAADILMGLGTGFAAKTILDPPIEGAAGNRPANTSGGIRVIHSQETAQPQRQVQNTQIQPQIGGNPYL